MSCFPAVVVPSLSTSMSQRTESAAGGKRKTHHQQQQQQQTGSKLTKQPSQNQIFSSTVSSSNRRNNINALTSSSSSALAVNLRNAAREARYSEDCLMNSSVFSISENNCRNATASGGALFPILHSPTTGRSSNQNFMMMMMMVESTNPFDALLAKIQIELNEIKKKIPVVSPSENTLQEFYQAAMSSASSTTDHPFVQDVESPTSERTLFPPKRPSPPNTITTATTTTTKKNESEQPQSVPPLLYELRNGKRRGGGSFSHSQQLALERDQHRQKLDQVWRCAQGWKQRTKETENSFKRFAQSFIFDMEFDKLVEREAKYRFEMIAFEQECWMEEILMPLIQKLSSEMSRRGCYVPPRSSSLALSNSTTEELPEWLNALHRREKMKQPQDLLQKGTSDAATTIYRVKDSDLLRALKVAEGRLAELGEPSVRMLSVGKNLVTY